ncbi:MAG TPA: decaprenyl-phosphate phosphoribosyltransferase [Candidatus Sulfotelmatobacter sp.]|jgi:4-hydroxybenzoate polyprenyltransferase|nr:decaprenyl-phosphate phosphoribosyltransferase [Candidatus Sulfotelmatobacter sp.]
MTRPPRSPLAAFLSALRPRQWVKNVFVLAALVFAGRLHDPAAVLRALAAFGVFCLLSSSVYLFNDIRDRDADRAHPKKRHRAIASGELAPGVAAGASVLLAIAALVAAFALTPRLGGVAAAYFVLNLAYSFGLKRVVILDVMLVAAGFLLRAWAGAAVLDVAISHWLVLCTGLLALFLGFVKRRQELQALGGTEATRAILKEYSLEYLDQMIAVVTGATVVAYALYAFSPEVAQKLGTRTIGLTIPFVVFGIFRYLYLVHQRGEGENPTALVLSDPPLVVDILLWGLSVVVALYVWR